MLPENPNSHIGINATSISQQTTPSLLELAEQVAAAATAIAKQLREKNVAEPRLHPPCAGLPDDPEIKEARQQLLVASRALGVLSHDPLSHLRETILQFNECAALVLVVDWKIAHILELDGTPMHISEIAKRAGAAADEYKLVSALRMLTTQYIFAELKPGYFAHNSSSVYLAREETELLIGHCNEVLVPSAFKVSEAMRKWPASTNPTETAFTIGHKTSSPFFPWLLEHPAHITRFNKIMRVMAESSYARLRSVYPWRSLGKSTIVDLAGGNGHISHQIAYEAPELRFVLADLENAVKDAPSALCYNYLASPLYKLLPAAPSALCYNYLASPLYKLLPMNLLFVKLNHHLLGLPVPSAYIRASSRWPISCLICDMYPFNCSASLLSLGPW